LPFMHIEYRTRGRFRERNLYRNTPILITAQRIAPEAYNRLFGIRVNDNGSITISLNHGNDHVFSINGYLNEWIETSWFTIKVQHINQNLQNFDIYFKFRDRGSLILEFMGRLQPQILEQGSSILALSLQSSTYERDIDFINKLSEVFIADNLALKNEVASRTISFIDQQLALLEVDLGRSADDLANFRENNHFINLQNHTQGIIARQNTLENLQAQIDTRRKFLDYLIDFLNDNLATGEIIVPPSVALDNPQMLVFTNQLSELNLFLAEINEGHIAYDRTVREINNTKARIRVEIEAMRLNLQWEQEILNRRMADLTDEIHLLPRREIDLATLERRFRIEESYYTFFLQRRAEAEVQKASNRSDIVVLDRARVLGMTNAGEQSNRIRNYLLISIVLSFGFVFLLKLLNTKAMTIRDIEKASQFPVAGSTLRTKTKDPMLLIKHPRSSVAETFRIIRTRLEFISQRKSNLMITISSPESGDGKTYFSANLAAIYALTGKKTILVDMDIRKPNMHLFFGTHNEPGVTNFLIGEIELKDAIKKTANEQYDLLTTGTIPPNPGELIRSEKLKKMFEELKKMYDFIIVDTSPVGLVTDAYAVMLYSDINLIVARLGKTHKQGIKTITERLEEDKIHNVYTIINDVTAERARYSKYNSYYGNNYYSYTAKISKRKREAAKNYAKYYTDSEDI